MSPAYGRIYAIVRRVPAGRVATYGQVARLAGIVNGARQVGYALHALREHAAVPWHRVVNARGAISLRGGADATQRILLEREGFIVFEAADGVKALDEIDRAAPDIVVLDLNLPKLDGYGVLSHLRARPDTQELPVIVLTAKGDEESEVRVFEFGASDYLTKPFRPRALSARLHSLLARRRS